MTGKETAPDGWTLSWNREHMPHSIECWNADHVRQWHISGEISDSKLARELRRFRREHSRPTQKETHP